ncbi:glycosyltransferase family 10 domain-containing protein [Roseobacter sp. SK209-2-6]|uniref:glycosyltransferase family 10 domain-containing protein n=1 Tax=Roseobacter sp. SK209-2-6 TaxID=388739 RepID=UPI0005621058|nr:glycosyltransferase family 10 [Roseobacter sp. SK209-2-6]
MTEAAIAVAPYGVTLGKSLADLPLSALAWPLGCPERLQGGRVCDLGPQDHLVLYIKRAMHWQSHRHCKAQISVMVMEPRIMSRQHHWLLRLSHSRFFRVFTYDPALLKALPNAEFLAFGTTWVPEWRDLDLTKHKDLSLIASAKRDHPGHQLRHEIVGHLQDAVCDADILGRGYRSFDAKAEGLAPYHYSVVIENVREENYFSEKLIDALLCETVPIYWGCPNIADFLPGEGIISCNTHSEIKAAVSSISEADYLRRLAGLREIKHEASLLADLPMRAAKALRASLP